MFFKQKNKSAHKRGSEALGQKGIALLLVLTAISVLTVAGVEFAYNTNVAYTLANNELDRLKARYLAQSAYQFMLLELKFDKVFRKVIEKQNLGQLLGPAAKLPLCQQFPLSTGLIRAVFTGSGEDLPEEISQFVSLADSQGALDFLNFEGDFDAACIDESTKINLNHFAKLDPEKSKKDDANTYHGYKNYLVKILSHPQYERLFEEADVKVENVVQNIADWVDGNNVINENEGSGSGAESSLYQQDVQTFEIKNDKLTTLSELYQVKGVSDVWFRPIAERFTIYGDGKINICAASEDLIEAIVTRFVELAPDLPPLRLADPEVMQRLVAAVQEGCGAGGSGDALIKAIADKLLAAIGLEAADTEEVSSDSKFAQEALKQMITDESRFFSLQLTGQSNDAIVRINTVVDIKGKNPKKWPVLYWKEY